MLLLSSATRIVGTVYTSGALPPYGQEAPFLPLLEHSCGKASTDSKASRAAEVTCGFERHAAESKAPSGMKVGSAEPRCSRFCGLSFAFVGAGSPRPFVGCPMLVLRGWGLFCLAVENETHYRSRKCK